jgi:hypothetical protein
MLRKESSIFSLFGSVCGSADESWGRNGYVVWVWKCEFRFHNRLIANPYKTESTKNTSQMLLFDYLRTMHWVQNPAFFQGHQQRPTGQLSEKT